jgi:hypothetical protein
MFKKEKKITVYDMIKKLRALENLGVDIYEAEIKIGKTCLEIEDKETSVHIYDESMHVYTKTK